MVFNEDELARVDKVLRGGIALDATSLDDSEKLGIELSTKYGQELKLRGLAEAQEYFREAHALFQKQMKVEQWIKRDSKNR